MLDCYRLARFYGQSPGHFLSMTMSEVKRDTYWTFRLMESMDRK